MSLSCKFSHDVAASRRLTRYGSVLARWEHCKYGFKLLSSFKFVGTTLALAVAQMVHRLFSRGEWARTTRYYKGERNHKA